MGNDNLTGQMLGQYELRELLGVGGMGSVYRGFQTTLKREVAVKVLPSTLAQQTGYMERFTREAETAAALEHPHIVPIVDYGTQRGVSYVVMRLLTGGTLAERINHAQFENRGMPSLGETAKLLRELASALDYAHNRGVIHRDIKTSNVMFDNQGNAYLVDFGIAKLMHATNKLTGTGVAVGTPTYMAPEQWAGEEVFPATDQYSLGVLAYIAVTGREPFEASTPFQLLNKHLHEMPTPLTVLRGDLPPSLDLVLARALAKDPKARFPTCTAFAQAFESAIEGNKGGETNFFVFKVPPKQQATFAPQPVMATPPSSGTPPPQYTPTGAMYPTSAPKRNNGLIIGMSLIILLLIGAVIALLVSNNRGDDAPATETQGTSVPPVVILASDEPIITPPDYTQTALAVFMTQTAIAIQNIPTETPIAPTDVPVRVTNTPLPSYTPVPPTNTAVRMTNTPLPTYTPIPPTNTAVPMTNTPLPSYTPAFTSPQAQISGFGAWVRAYPDEDSALLGAIDETVDIVGVSSDGEWGQIAYQDELGWIELNNTITLIGDISTLPVIEVVIPTATVIADQPQITISGFGTWVRAKPDGDSTLLGSIINETVDILGISSDGNWVQIAYHDELGWIELGNMAVTIIGDISTLPVIDVVIPTTTPVTGILTVNQLGAYIRALPDTSSRRLGTIIGNEITVLGISEDRLWYAVDYEGVTAWIAKDINSNLNIDDRQLLVIPIQLTITIDGLGVWVRALPQSDARRLGSLISVTVDVLGISEDGGWYAVMYQDEVGWIGKSDSAVLNGDDDQLTVITP